MKGVIQFLWPHLRQYRRQYALGFGALTAKDFLGEYLDFQLKVGDVVLLARAHPSLRTPVGDAIYLRMKAEKCVAIPSDMTQKSAVGPN